MRCLHAAVLLAHSGARRGQVAIRLCRRRRRRRRRRRVACVRQLGGGKSGGGKHEDASDGVRRLIKTACGGERRRPQALAHSRAVKIKKRQPEKNRRRLADDRRPPARPLAAFSSHEFALETRAGAAPLAVAHFKRVRACERAGGGGVGENADSPAANSPPPPSPPPPPPSPPPPPPQPQNGGSFAAAARLLALTRTHLAADRRRHQRLEPRHRGNRHAASVGAPRRVRDKQTKRCRRGPKRARSTREPPNRRQKKSRLPPLSAPGS